MANIMVLYHAQCQDGFCAAWVAHRYFHGEGDYIPVQYGQPCPDVKDKEVYLLDFSYKRPEMLGIIEDARAVVVLDHHKSAAAELAGDLSVVRHIPHLSVRTPHIVFDMEKSGGRLTWEFFFPGKPTPWLVDYTEARDLWTFHLPFSREVSAAIASYPMDFKVWDDLERALANDPSDLRGMRNCVRETAEEWKRRKA